MKDKPINWISLKTGNKYSFDTYINHGYGGLHGGFKDLPKEEYPYTLEYNDRNKQNIPN